jgi:hypothetical protein
LRSFASSATPLGGVVGRDFFKKDGSFMEDERSGNGGIEELLSATVGRLFSNEDCFLAGLNQLSLEKNEEFSYIEGLPLASVLA